ncbi:hypothetical protein [Winogradskyella ursingii]|uniref:hypothetical protein n=1 Tax=Winogradskyella ursingii TaxID=2686079 RepID=UPI0015C96F98|nr:hypothetical protein [Winogradskyella ursingii]
MKLNQKTLKVLLDKDYKIAENEIENQYRFYANFDKDISDWLSSMHHFGGYGEFYEMVALFNSRLFN